MRRGFSPLQIGEGLSSPRRLRGAAGRVSFQSPSDRGGPFKHPQRIALRSHPKFQSPSDRGGPFKWTEAPPIVIVLVCFSPLQIGEGLSRAMRANCACRTGLFQSPSDRGGPFKPAQSNQKHKTAVVSVPFRSGRAFQAGWTTCRMRRGLTVSVPFRSGRAFQAHPLPGSGAN